MPYQCSNWQRSGYSCNDNHQPHNCAHTNRSQINTNIQQLIWQLHHCHCRVAVWGAKLFPNWVEYEHYVEYYWILMTSINNKIFSAMLWWDRDKLDVTRELVMCSRSTSTVPPTQQQQYTLGIIMKNCGLSHFKCHPDLDWVLMWTGKQWGMDCLPPNTVPHQLSIWVIVTLDHQESQNTSEDQLSMMHT